jgi:chemotaxis signal transduction protein
MNHRPTALSAQELRESFDASFAKEVVEATADREDLLLVRDGMAELAMRVREIAAVEKCPELTSLPSSRPALLGLAGIRGHLAAIYSLGALVGSGGASARGGLVVLCAGDRSVGLRFDEMLAYVRVDRKELGAASAAATTVLRAADRSVLLVDLRVLFETIHDAARTGAHQEG